MIASSYVIAGAGRGSFFDRPAGRGPAIRQGVAVRLAIPLPTYCGGGGSAESPAETQPAVSRTGR